MQRVGQWRDHVLQRRTLAGGDHHVRLHSRDDFLAGAIVDRRIRQIDQAEKIRLFVVSSTSRSWEIGAADIICIRRDRSEGDHISGPPARDARSN